MIAVVPFAGTWIETEGRHGQTERQLVVPFAGVWIETLPGIPPGRQCMRCSLRGGVGCPRWASLYRSSWQLTAQECGSVSGLGEIPFIYSNEHQGDFLSGRKSPIVFIRCLICFTMMNTILWREICAVEMAPNIGCVFFLLLCIRGP